MGKITKVSANVPKIIEHFECSGDFRKFLKAYLCPAGKWTIGLGTTLYPDGKPVMPGDVITEQRALECFNHDIAMFETAVADMVTSNVTQAQFDALVDFCYNAGAGRLVSSTLLKLVNANSNDARIMNAFLAWKFAGDGSHNGVDDDGDGVIDEPGERALSPGLIRRRKCESWLYFNGTLRFYFNEN